MTRAVDPLTREEISALLERGDRIKLPDRRPAMLSKIYYPFRPSEAEAIHALGKFVYVTAGFDPSTLQVREIFARGGSKVGEDIDTALDDVALALSCLLQIGQPLEVLAETVPARLAHYLVGVDADERRQLIARTAIAAIIHAAIQMEAAMSLGHELEDRTPPQPKGTEP